MTFSFCHSFYVAHKIAKIIFFMGAVHFFSTHSKIGVYLCLCMFHLCSHSETQTQNVFAYLLVLSMYFIVLTLTCLSDL